VLFCGRGFNLFRAGVARGFLGIRQHYTVVGA
jgi:hypothetical protein